LTVSEQGRLEALRRHVHGLLRPGIRGLGTACPIVPDWSCPASFNIYALYRRSKIPAPRVSAFIQFVREAFAAFDPQELTVLHASMTAERPALAGSASPLPGAL
jgi:hypothetical protein